MTITLQMNDGTPQEFNILNTLEHNGKQYVALSELDSEEYDILRFEEVGDDEDNIALSIIEDDEEYNTVADRFDELFASEVDNADQN